MASTHLRLTVSPAALTVEFDPPIYSVDEGSRVDFIIRLSTPADRDVTVDFTTVPGSATGKLALNSFIIISVQFVQFLLYQLGFNCVKSSPWQLKSSSWQLKSSLASNTWWPRHLITIE